ncbi:MAG: hypothetical protein DCF25_07365 [Leptolyngbya foveolarum]|uniref:Uncharacterized protein n=1 Tax=Leptolyngbya foveolarum TaxID=47253 RepID=A0A2W4UFC8_9CYAN|nr:MAG: hypothetical protein DCF25_07365 [Leptolyngbya foveolarum]
MAQLFRDLRSVRAVHHRKVVEQFAVDEAEAAADLLGEAAFGGVFEELSVVVGDVALVVEKVTMGYLAL